MTDERMTAARARAIVEDNDEMDGIAGIVADAPPPPIEAIAQLRTDGCPVLDEPDEHREAS